MCCVNDAVTSRSLSDVIRFALRGRKPHASYIEQPAQVGLPHKSSIARIASK
jgi:hypothetical protein